MLPALKEEAKKRQRSHLMRGDQVPVPPVSAQRDSGEAARLFCGKRLCPAPRLAFGRFVSPPRLPRKPKAADSPPLVRPAYPLSTVQGNPT